MVDLKSMWSPKFPGLADVTKNWGLSGTEWNPLSFLFALSLYSLIKPKLLLSSTARYECYVELVLWNEKVGDWSSGCLKLFL